MTDTETKFRNWAKKTFPDAYIKKIPDFKQMGHGAVVGLPDYMIIFKGETFWYEVKKVPGKTLSQHHFTPGQLIEFKKMYDAGVNVLIYVFGKDITWETDFKSIIEKATG